MHQLDAPERYRALLQSTADDGAPRELNQAEAERKSRGKRRAIVFLLLAALAVPFPAQLPAQNTAHSYQQRGKIRSISQTELVLEAVDLPAPQVFVLNDATQSGPLKAGELVQVTFVLDGERKLARVVAEIVATAVNLPRGDAAASGSSSAPVNLPRGSAREGGGTSASVHLPRGSAVQGTASSSEVNLPTGSATPRAITSAPVNLAADEAQMALIRGPGMHQSGVAQPMRIAILDIQPTPSADLTPELAAGIADRLQGLLQNDALFTLLDRGRLHDIPVSNLNDPASVMQMAKGLDAPDAILLGEIHEEQPSPSEDSGPRRRKIQVTYPTITLEGRLYDAHTGQLLGAPKGSGGGQQDRPDDRSSPVLRAIRDAVESFAAAIDAEYPPLLDSRTFVTVTGVEAGRLTVSFPGTPTVQLGNRLQVSHPTWFTRDPATGHLIAVSPETLGMLTITNLERSEAAGTYQGTPPVVGQTVRLSR